MLCIVRYVPKHEKIWLYLGLGEKLPKMLDALMHCMNINEWSNFNNVLLRKITSIRIFGNSSNFLTEPLQSRVYCIQIC
jgi:hypothetical protein